jgi:hypothetical protein
MIVSAAISRNGAIHTGRRHAEIMYEMIRRGEGPIRQEEQGFIDDAGNFLSRSEAYEHAVACGQIVRSRNKTSLLSEDLR